MASTHQNSYPLPPPPQAQSEFKLPSLKDLNFPYRSPVSGGPSSAQDPPAPSANASASSEYASPAYQPPRRGWSRSSSTSVSTPSSVHPTLHSPQQPQHPQYLPQHQQQHHQPLSRHVSYPYGQDSTHPPTQMPPPQSSHHLGAGPSPRDEPHQSHKRPRSGSTSISTPSTHSQHNVYPTSHPSSHPTYPPPPSPQHALPVPPSYNQPSHTHPPPGALPREPAHHAPPPSSYQTHAGYPPYQSNYPAQQRPPPPHPPSSHIPPPTQSHPHQPPPPQAQQMNPPAYPQSQPPNHWPPLQSPASSLPLPPGPQQQTGYPGPPHPPSFSGSYPRPPPQVVSNPTEAANTGHPIPIQTSKLSSPTTGPRQVLVAEITSNCKVLYEFASRYARLQASRGDIKPSKEEIADMTKRAARVAQLLRDLKKIVNPHAASSGDEKAAVSATSDEYRAPKRPWEEISKDQTVPSHTPTATNPGHQRTASLSEKSGGQQTTAEKDMEIIRSKRASSTGGSIVGQQKSKYRKRSRASPPGKCHSCNIRETPEWRRGPDGARTLCNACGLHYAKLMRKRYKEDGKPVDLQTLRASTAQARGGATGALVDGGTPPPPTPTKSSDAGSPSTIRSQRLSISSGTGPTNSGSNTKGSQVYQMSVSGPPPPSPSELPLPGYVPPENNYMPPASSSASTLPLPPPQQPQPQSSSSGPSMNIHSPASNLPPRSQQIPGHHHHYQSQSQHPPPQPSPHSHPHQSLPPPPPPGPLGHSGSSSGSTGVMPPWLSRSGYGHGGGMGGMYRGGPDR